MVTKTSSKKPSTAAKSNARLTLATTAPTAADNSTSVSAEENFASKNESTGKAESAPSAKANKNTARTGGNVSGRKAGAVSSRSGASRPKSATGKRPAASGNKSSSRQSATATKTKPAQPSARRAAEKVVSFSTQTMRDTLGTQRLQNQASRFSREGAEQMSRHANAASRAMSEGVAIMKGNVETCVECGTITANMTRKVSEEAFNFANDVFSTNVEISKDIFACRTINDVFDLHNRMVRTNLDSLFSQSARMSEMLFDYVNQAVEPMSDRLSQTTERLSRSIAA